MKKLVFSLILTSCFCAGSGFAEDYKLSMLPRYFPEKLSAMITPLAAYLSQESGDTITPVLTANFDKYQAEVKSGNIELGYENPLVYVNLSEVHEVLATAIKGKGGDKFWGIIITRPDSDIKTIKDLAGKSIMIVSEDSAGGFLSQKMSLSENGLDAQQDCTLSEAADNHQENVIISVSVGDVDAGFIRASALHKADDFIMPGSITVMTETAKLPNWAFSVPRTMPQEKKETLRQALLNLNADSEVMQAMGLDGFKAATDSDYDVMRAIIK